MVAGNRQTLVIWNSRSSFGSPNHWVAKMVAGLGNISAFRRSMRLDDEFWKSAARKVRVKSVQGITELNSRYAKLVAPQGKSLSEVGYARRQSFD